MISFELLRLLLEGLMQLVEATLATVSHRRLSFNWHGLDRVLLHQHRIFNFSRSTPPS
ncbi:hypothetical protein KP509_14G079000 [Ceratopteris richardii]|uniref:Secreted protein n=1 Tax=Ceratopteris richardii TaxID=49495 RepID=A0A8T2T9I2_CERRI|nr:hypothetical protein KP509_14G079000 [Ceratopteris richardii]